MLTFLALLIVIGALYAISEYNRLHPKMLLDWSPAMSPVAYERYCAEVLRYAGWQAHTTSTTGDQGIDVLANKQGVRVVIQCKLYSNPVGNSAVQQALAGRAFVNAHLAVVVSNAAYTRSARVLAQRTGVHLLHHRDLAHADRLFLAR